jgi:hypothetical protein
MRYLGRAEQFDGTPYILIEKGDDADAVIEFAFSQDAIYRRNAREAYVVQFASDDPDNPNLVMLITETALRAAIARFNKTNE